MSLSLPLPIPSNLRGKRHWCFLVLVTPKGPSQTTSPQHTETSSSLGQALVPWMQWGSQATSETPSPSPWWSPKYCFSCSQFSSSAMPTSSAPDSLARRWRKGVGCQEPNGRPKAIKWTRRFELLIPARRNHQSLSFCCFSTGLSRIVLAFSYAERLRLSASCPKRERSVIPFIHPPVRCPGFSYPAKLFRDETAGHDCLPCVKYVVRCLSARIYLVLAHSLGDLGQVRLLSRPWFSAFRNGGDNSTL